MSCHTLAAYRRGLNDLLGAWQGENLLRPRRNAGVLYVRELESRLKPASVGVKLAAAKAFYAALRWSGATDTAPFADVRAAVDKTPSWEKRDAYTQTEVHWLERTSESYTLYIVLLGAHAGLRVSEMTALKWEDIDLGSGMLKVVAGKGGKIARVNLSSTGVSWFAQMNDYGGRATEGDQNKGLGTADMVASKLLSGASHVNRNLEAWTAQPLYLSASISSSTMWSVSPRKIAVET